MIRHLADLWEAMADEIPDEPALIHGNLSRTWRDFDDRASRLAGAMAAAGVGPGTTVAINLYNCNEWLEAFYASIKLRAVPANINYRYLGEELHHLLSQAEAGVLVYHASLADRVEAALSGLPGLHMLIEVADAEPTAAIKGKNEYEDLVAQNSPLPRGTRPADDTILAFTGGTTGLPKGVSFRLDLLIETAIASRNLLFGLALDPSTDPLSAARQLQRDGALTVALPASPLMHSTGLLWASIPALLTGGSVVTLRRRSFDADELFETVARTQATTLAIVGDAFAIPMLHALGARAAAGAPYDTSSLRSICSAGVAWSAAVKEALLEHIPQVVLSDACGTTEGASYGSRLVTAGQYASTDNFEARPGVKVVDAERRPLTAGKTGFLVSPTPATGYFNDPAATARAFFLEDGIQYVMPGDLGRLEVDGTITLLGRGSATINTGGEKVYPAEVEEVLRTVPGVEDCLVFGIRDERFGERVCAILQAPGEVVDTDAVTHVARAHLAGYKLPRVLVVGPVPRFPNGKPDYESARMQAADAHQ